MPDTHKYTKEEAENLKRAVQDILLFLRLGDLRIENRPDAIPFKPETGHAVISWLRALANRYDKGDDITT